MPPGASLPHAAATEQRRTFFLVHSLVNSISLLHDHHFTAFVASCNSGIPGIRGCLVQFQAVCTIRISTPFLLDISVITWLFIWKEPTQRRRPKFLERVKTSKRLRIIYNILQGFNTIYCIGPCCKVTWWADRILTRYNCLVKKCAELIDVFLANLICRKTASRFFFRHPACIHRTHKTPIRNAFCFVVIDDTVACCVGVPTR